MSNFRDTLSKLQSRFVAPLGCNLGYARKRMLSNMKLIDQLTEDGTNQELATAALGIALSDLIFDALDVAVGIKGFDLHRELSARAATRNRKIDEVKTYGDHYEKLYEECAAAARNSLFSSRDLMNAAMYASSMSHNIHESFDALMYVHPRSKLERVEAIKTEDDKRRDILTQVWKTLAAAGIKTTDQAVFSTIFNRDAHYVTVQKTDNFLPSVIEGVCRDLKNLNAEFNSMRAANQLLVSERDKALQSLEATRTNAARDSKNHNELYAKTASERDVYKGERDAAREKLEKCRLAVETMSINPDPLQACLSAAKAHQEQYRRLNQTWNDNAAANETKRKAEQEVTSIRTQFAEYRRNAELHTPKLAEMRARLEIAALEDNVTIRVWPRQGRIHVEGWRVPATNMEAVMQKMCGRLMKPELVRETATLVETAIRKLDGQLVTKVTEGHVSAVHAYDDEQSITIHINKDRRDFLAFANLDKV